MHGITFRQSSYSGQRTVFRLGGVGHLYTSLLLEQTIMDVYEVSIPFILQSCCSNNYRISRVYESPKRTVCRPAYSTSQPTNRPTDRPTNRPTDRPNSSSYALITRSQTVAGVPSPAAAQSPEPHSAAAQTQQPRACRGRASCPNVFVVVVFAAVAVSSSPFS